MEIPQETPPGGSCAWTAARGPEISSFTEAACRLFDDSGLGAALEKRQAIFGRAIDANLHRLNALVGRVDDLQTPQSIIDDPLMEEIRMLCRDTLDRLAGEDGNGGGPGQLQEHP